MFSISLAAFGRSGESDPGVDRDLRLPTLNCRALCIDRVPTAPVMGSVTRNALDEARGEDEHPGAQHQGGPLRGASDHRAAKVVVWALPSMVTGFLSRQPSLGAG